MSEESVANLLKGCSEVIFRDLVEPIEQLYCVVPATVRDPLTTCWLGCHR